MSKEHILVCLSSSPSNERIVRMAEKMAQAFCGSLTALYVQTPGDADMNAEDTVRLQANMCLAQQLGAEIVTTHGEDVPTQIAEYARLSDVTKIVIGRSGVKRRHFWSEPTLTERLIALARHSHYSRCGSLQKLSQEPADRYLPGASDRLGTASDCRDFGGCNDHWMGLSAARLCRCQYHYGLPTGCASDLRLYQRVYLRCAVRFFERHPV